MEINKEEKEMHSIYFEKVSFEEFEHALRKMSMFEFATKTLIREVYDKISIPRRATNGSAGYDFKAPFDIHLQSGETIQFPTGIRAIMPEDVVLLLTPRSGLGFNHRVQLDNTIGVIDSDYQYSDNEGHIQCKMTCDARKSDFVKIESGQGYMQGIFVRYLKTDDDSTTETRNGGFGSTDKKG
jgi:dUTP pyrophosphatase